MWSLSAARAKSVCPESPRARGLCLGLILALLPAAFTSVKAAEDRPGPVGYRWVDARGVAHVSNLPPAAFGRDGEPRAAYHPCRAEAQYPAMLQALRAREAELIEARQAADKASVAKTTDAADPEAGNAAQARVIPKRRMSMSELLSLEKNAGRPVE